MAHFAVSSHGRRHVFLDCAIGIPPGFTVVCCAPLHQGVRICDHVESVEHGSGSQFAEDRI